MIPVTLATVALSWIIGAEAIQAKSSQVKEVKVSKQISKTENSTIKAALAEFKTEADFDTWLKMPGDDYSDEMKIIAAPDPDGHTGWIMGASGSAGTVMDKNGKVIAEYSFDNPSQVATIGEIKQALIAHDANVGN
jgi:hypothetical protein